MAFIKLVVALEPSKVESVADSGKENVYVNTDYIVKMDEIMDKSLIRRSRVHLVDGTVLVTSKQMASIAEEHNRSAMAQV